jgi:hypothetical protein
MLKKSLLVLEARPFFFLNFKGTPSQEEQKTFLAA